ncbi:SIMPL domain-containing protein [Stutzerimonas urumqiensis]
MLAYRLLPSCLLGLALSIAGTAAMADDALRYNQVSLHADASTEVVQDRMHVTLYSEAQQEDPAQLAAQTTQTLNAALQKARAQKGVTVSLGSRHSYPVYGEDGERIVAWRERAEIRLESTDFAALSTLTAELLKTLKMGEMHFSVSEAIRKQNEEALMKDAVAAFRARAQLATEALGGSGYKLVSLNLGSEGGMHPVNRGYAMKSLMEAAPVPEIEAGTQTITLNADGVIEVQMP